MARERNRLPRVGQTPRADFMPPRVRMLYAGRISRGRLTAVTVVVLAACALAYFGAQSLLLTSQRQLDHARAKTDEILVEQAKFSDIVTFLTESDHLGAAYVLASATETDWSSLIQDMVAGVPTGGAITSLSLEAPSAVESPTDTAPITREPVVVKALISLRTQSFVDLEYYLLNATSWKGFSNSVITSMRAKGSVFESTLTISFGVKAFAQANAKNLAGIGFGTK